LTAGDLLIRSLLSSSRSFALTAGEPGDAGRGGVEVPEGLGVVGVAAPGCVTVGAPALGALGALGTGVAVVGATATGGAVTVVGVGVVVESKFPPSSTSAAASTPSDNVATTAIATIGALQLEDVARRVRAAAPQRRHHS
jgi:hypothetical protein